MKSFRRQLSESYILGIAILTLGASLLTAWQATTEIRRHIESQAVKLVRQLADDSAVALLTESYENAQDATRATLSFPNVRYVSIVDAKGGILFEAGEAPSIRDLVGTRLVDSQATKVLETEDFMYFAAPVVVEEAMSSLDDIQSEMAVSRRIGNVYLAITTEPLTHMQRRTFTNNVLVSLAIASALLVALLLLARRMTTPLTELSEMMRYGRREPERLSPEGEAPAEIDIIAEAYHSMLAQIDDRDRQLREYAEHLEEVVQSRTRELVAARDDALAANRAKSAFLANVSHELRTPLQAIIGYGKLLEQTAADRTTLTRTRSIASSAEHLLVLIDSLLDLSKIEAEHPQVRETSFDLPALVTSVRGTVELLLKDNNTLEVALSPELQSMRSDETRLRQVLLNLLGNANKFTANGRITLTVEPVAEKGGWLRFIVRDTGRGIAPQDQQRIFEKFYQAPDVVKGHYGGTGIGLALTRSICELLGGTISVESELGQGAVFTVELPGLVTQSTAVARPRRQGAQRILLAEDDKLLCELLAEILQLAGHTPQTVSDGQEALRALLDESADWQVAILDHRMPSLTGLEIIQQYFRAQQNPIPIIVLTADISEATRREFEAYDVILLTKPLQPDELLSVIDSLSAPNSD